MEATTTSRDDRVLVMTTPKSPLIDRIAMFVAAACGLHCICFPVLLGITDASSFIQGVSGPLETVFIVSAFILGLTNLSFSWWRSHHRPECLVLFAVGMAMILIYDRLSGVVMSASVSVSGGALMGAAHFRNIQLLRTCGCCDSTSQCKRSHEA